MTAVPVPLGASRRRRRCACVLLVGVGGGGRRLPPAGAALARAAADRDALATTVAAVAAPVGLEAFVVGAMLGSFALPLALDRARAPPGRPGRSWPASPTPTGPAGRAVAIGGAAWRSRVLAWVPANLKNPAWLAEQAARSPPTPAWR